MSGVGRGQVLRVRGRGVAWLPPLLLLVAITAIDYNTAAELRMISWVVLVPGIAAATCGVAGTAVFAALALVTYVAADSSWPHQYQSGLPDFILAVLACAVRLRGERSMLHMRDVADTTRRTVLRPLPPVWGGLEHAEVYLAADSEARVGGDFYDIQPGPHGTRVLVGDVQGKGLGAVEETAALLGTFREAAYHEPALATVAERLEVRVRRHGGHVTALGRDDGDRFATAVLLGFPEADTGVVEAMVFGHEPPLVVGPSGVRPLLAADGPPPVHRVPLGPGETVLLTSDGVTEARDPAGEFYALAGDPRAVEPRRLVALVRDGTLGHCGGHLLDDTTVFAVRRADERAGKGRRPS
ncbi:PP2C family protein-serine/threonine phosphatase [Streptomyces pseudovenezuelae]|uniref:PP2C family protein-serine/threonine phosphatase n=1 Tax=Streptomyces pseudovenezuelae TaxID=67350 RepID=UPI0034A3877F